MAVKIDLKIFLWIAFFCFFHQAEIYAVLIFFALVHEIGHLTAGLLLGYEASQICITPVGVAIHLKEKRAYYREKIAKGTKRDLEEIMIASAGPLTNFLILSICFFMGLEESSIQYANWILGVFNLLPIYPLDGGRIFKGLGNIFWGRKKSWKRTNQVANWLMIVLSILASIAILYFKNIGLVIMSIYLWGIVIKENQIYEKRMRLYEQIEVYERQIDDNKANNPLKNY